MHLAGKDFSKAQENLRSLGWWQKTVPLVLPHLNPAQKELLSNELSTQEQFFSSDQYALLPSGASHCDLFRDNVLFDAKGSLDTADTAADHLGGFFDFYFAGNDKWLFDLAVTANDWCLAIYSSTHSRRASELAADVARCCAALLDFSTMGFLFAA
jgi:homoserine kinase type II